MSREQGPSPISHTGANHGLKEVPVDIHRRIMEVRGIFRQAVVGEVRNAFHAALGTRGNGLEGYHMGSELQAILTQVQSHFADLRTRLEDFVDEELDRLLGVAVSPALGHPDGSVGEQGGETRAAVAQSLTTSTGSPRKDSVARSELYHGMVRLKVGRYPDLRPAVSFLAQLRKVPQIRLFQVSGNPFHEGLDILLGLRESLNLKDLLLELDVIAEVTGPSDVEPASAESLLYVQLKEVRGEEDQPGS